MWGASIASLAVQIRASHGFAYCFLHLCLILLQSLICVYLILFIYIYTVYYIYIECISTSLIFVGVVLGENPPGVSCVAAYFGSTTLPIHRCP
jgi:hypothetical protein